jgi:hypothetical protein
MTTKQQAVDALKNYLVAIPDRWRAIEPEAEAAMLERLAIMFRDVVELPENHEERLKALVEAHDPARQTERAERHRQQAISRQSVKLPTNAAPIQPIVIVDLVVAYCGITRQGLFSGNRHSTLARARALACRLLRWSGLSWPEVAAAVGSSSHATAISAARRAGTDHGRDVSALLTIIGKGGANAPQPPPVAIAATESPSSVTDDPRVENEPQTHLAALQGD